MLSKPPLIAFNGALFHVTMGQEHANNVSIKATTALKQTVWYQLVDETWGSCEHKSGSTSSWKVKQISNSIFDKALLRKGLELLVQLLKRIQMSDQVTPYNQKTRNSQEWYDTSRGINCRTGVIFLRILGKQKRKRGERGARVAREGKSAKKVTPYFFRAFPSRSPRFRLCSPKIRQNNYACSAGYPRKERRTL